MTAPDALVLAEHVELAGADVLDIGCGAGALVRWIRERGGNPTGVECGEIMRQRALDADPEHHDAYVDAVGEDLPFDDDTFDLVVFKYSLHHVPGPHMVDALREAQRVVRTGGTIWIAEPIAAGPGHDVDRLVDDETAVRAEAQAAIQTWLAATTGAVSVAAEFDHPRRDTYADFGEYEQMMVGIDPTRRAEMDRRRPEVEARFEQNAERTDSGAYAFDGSVHVIQAHVA